MRWLVRILLFSCLALVCALFFSNQLLTRYAQKNKHSIEKTLSDLLQTDVQIEEILPKLLPLPKLIAINIQVSSGSEQQDFFINQITLTPQLKSLFTDRILFSGIKIELAEFVRQINNQELTLKNLNLESKLSFEDKKISLQDWQMDYLLNEQAYQLTGENLDYDSKNKLLEISDTLINTGQSKINLKFKLDSVNNLYEAGLSNFQIKLSDFYPLTKALLPTTTESLQEALFKDPTFQLTGESLTYDSKNKLLEVNNSQLKTAQSQINFEGKLDSINNLLTIGVAQFQINLPELYPLVKVLHPATAEWLRQGQASGNLEYQGAIFTDYQVTGNLNLAEIKYLKDYQVKTLNFNGLTFSSSTQTELKATAKTIATGLQIANHYRSDQLTGDFLLTHNKAKGLYIIGGPNFKNFGYQDGDLKLTNINAKIDPLQFWIDPQGNIESKLKIYGSSIKMTSPSFQINSASKVNIPMTLKIPKKGAYNVSGTVSVANGNIKYTKHNLQKLTGDVKVSLASALQSYESDLITFEENGINSNLKTNLKILPTEYQIPNLQTNYFGGDTNIQGKLGRKNNQTFQLKVLANNLHSARLKAFFFTDHKEPVEGEITNLSLDLHGLQNTIPKGLLGSGEFKFVQPQASRTGIAKKIISGLRSVPMVGHIFGSNKLSEVAESQTLNSKFRFADNNCYFETLKLSRPSYDLIGKGQISHDYQLNLKADVIMLQESASKFGLGIAPLEKLFGRAGRIVIPIYIKGQLPDYNVEPDLNNLVQNNTGITFGKKIFKGIGNTIFGKD